ncbi:right-handed parallel beta-helix repeat-containing protein [Patescibacteria group bacterium]
MKNKIFSKGLYFLIFTAIFAVLPLSASAATYVSGTISTDTVWTASSSPYVVQGIVALDQYRTLTIEPGVVVKFDTGALLHAHGTLNAQGTTEDKIYFTSIKDDSIGGDTNGDGDASVAAPGDWGFLNISTYLPRSPLSSIKNIVVRYGGGVDYNTTGAAVIISDSGLESIDNSEFAYNKVGLYNEYDSVEITNSNFHHNEIGVYSAPRHRGWGATRILTFNNNTISDNSLYGVDIGYYKPTYGVVSSSFDFNNNIFTNNPTALRVYSNTILSHSNNSASGGDKNGILIGDGIHPNTNWNADNIPYIIDGNIYYRGGTLTIDPGTVIKFTSPESILDIHARVFLHINGTQDEPVYFTSIKDDSVGGDTNGDGSASVPAAGDWGYVSIGEGSSNIGLDINYMKVRYGGGSFFRNNIYPALALSFNWYQYTLVKDYYLENIEVSNSKSGLYVHSVKHRFHLSNSSIHDNEDYGLYAYTYFRYGPNGEVDAQNNWWGDASGPYQVDQNPSGLGNEISGDVPTNASFDPWLTEDPLVSTPTCCSNVVFLPGLQGSRLYQNGVKLWEPTLTTNNEDIKPLFLNSDGTSENLDIVTGDIIDEVLEVNIYKKFVEFMDDELVATGVINEWGAIPYDWRLSFDQILSSGKKTGNSISYLQATSSPFIIQEINRLAETSQNGKVTIVAHSNGGLLAKALLQSLEDNNDPLLEKIDQLILVAVPQIGTPKAVEGLLHGDQIQFGLKEWGFLLDEEHAREFAENMQSAYNLLPSAEYFKKVADPVILFDANVSRLSELQNRAGSTITTADDLHSFLLGDSTRTEPDPNDEEYPNVLKSKLITSSTVTHNTILDQWKPTENLKVVQIAGWGEDTISGIEYSCGFIRCGSLSELDRDMKFTSEGDGTVVFPSAVFLDEDKYFVDIRRHNRAGIFNQQTNRDHADILEIESLQTMIKKFVDETIDNNNLPNFIGTTTPTENSSRKRITLRSPVAINIFDSTGLHTGPVENTSSDLRRTEAYIPNSYYREIAGHKYLGLDGSDTYRVELQGEDIGSFTLEIDDVLNDEITRSDTFINVPITQNTTGELTITESMTTALELDVDGDGVVDISINSGEEQNSETSLEILRNVVDQMDIQHGLKTDIQEKLKIAQKEFSKEKQDNAIKKLDDTIRKLEDEVHQNIKRTEKEKKIKISTEDAQKLIDIIVKIIDGMV